MIYELMLPVACFVFGVWIGRGNEWEDVRDTGVHLYQRNRRTGKRRVLRGGPNQPIDTHWLETGEWFSSKPPPGHKR
ncbi:MAG TPA: hypothetical protein VEA80_06770 [Vitreimonas sp.]|uniref:hypothetical protein n=1 Tax=Vitreimonas sp. TaxID=3069702 RepID=UPI002D302117|nr:hypothetical protein [Vitreimonas sp.]HYD87157.1 hypothetical protein [Vitreimonas sp.]